MWRPGPRIGLIHATPLSIEPAVAAFREHWPEARTVSLLDESLQSDADNTAYDGPSFTQRILALAEYQVANGAAALLFTCSAFSDAIKAAARAMDVPVLRPDEAAVEVALGYGKPLRILVTFGPTVRVVRKLVDEFRDDKDQPVAVQLVEGAHDAMRAGDPERHDELIAKAAAAAEEPVLLLAQYSMVRAAGAIERAAGRSPIAGPAHAVTMLKTLVESRA